MERINNLLSYLRGYSFLRPFHHPLLLGYGLSPDEKFNRARKKTLEYRNPDVEDDPISVWLDYFGNDEIILNDKYWSRANTKKMLKYLNSFIRQLILYETKNYKDYLTNLEDFMVSLREPALEEVLRMEKFLSNWPESEREFLDYREDARQYISDYLSQRYIRVNDHLSENGPFKRFVLDFILLLTHEPNDYEKNYDDFIRIMSKNYDSDTEQHFDEDLSETALEDYYDLHPEERDEESDSDEPPRKRRIEGSGGFYDWWWM